MTNDATRAEFWREFIGSRCHYPAPGRLRAQLASAEFSNFCDCDCNSFDVSIPADGDLLPLASPGGGGMFFEANFRLDGDRHLEVMLFVDDTGNLSFVEIDYQGNTEPVPDDLKVDSEPFHVWASDQLFA